MKRPIAAFMLVCLILSITACSKPAEKSKFSDYSFDYFDTVTTIVGYEETKEKFDAVCIEIKELLSEYHQLYNIYNRYEGINNLCTVNDLHDGEHRAVKVDKKIIDLLKLSKELYTLTDGKTNVAMGSVLSIWHQYRAQGLSDPSAASLPPMEKLTEAAKHTDINNVIINEKESTVFLSDPMMRLDVGAIAKGYAVEMVAQHLEAKGISAYSLNIGGNIRCVGERHDGKGWTAAIENPDLENKELPYIEYLELNQTSLVTSGSYQRYYTVDNVRYHHIIDPNTLMPSEYFRSVSVVCPHSGKADAISTALFSMSYEQGKTLVESLPDTEAMWVLSDGTQKYSSNFEKYTKEK